ncbi:MAG: type I polyketide synthase [Aureliella sp.]
MNNIDDFGGYGIAIVGMANRYPGAETPDEFWRNVRDGVESVARYTDEQLAERGVRQSLLRNPSYVKAGCPLDHVEDFDPEFFGFSPKEAAILDPQHRQFYECCWEAIERAGHAPSKFDGAIGVFAGSGMAAYYALNLLSNQDLVESVGPFLLRHTGNDKDFLSTRVSYCLNLTGPSINVQTACSTSAVAVHLACQSLLSEECDMALAGGVTVELPHRCGYLYKDGEILSPDGHCRAFDHRSKGTVFGSGAGAVVLRRLTDAVADGDHIHGVIIGSAVNNDGSGKVGYLAPSVGGQAAAITEALELADVDAQSIGYVECHGTGTPVGDPIEISALTTAFRRTASENGYCGVGSVKTNIGHLDTAAGVAGLMKATLALEHEAIPPTLNYESPNPSIDFETSPFFVNDALRPWPSGKGPRRAAINSLGVGGTNAFLIVEQAPERKPQQPSSVPFHPICISAKNRKSLDGYAKKLASFLEENPQQNFADVAYTLLEGREHFPVRRVLAAKDAAEAATLLRSLDERRTYVCTSNDSSPKLTFMFPGGGVQYPTMGRDLLETHGEFRKHMEAGFAYLNQKTGVDYRRILYADHTSNADIENQLQKPSIQLPLIFLVEYGLAKQWMSEGFEPDALIGHSMGENTAACLSGVMSFEDALGLVLLRGQLMDDVPPGGMLSVYLPAKQLEKQLFGSLTIAANNSPLLSVASGPKDELNQLAEKLTAKEIDNKPININIAAHSSMLDGILEPFRAYLNSIQLNPPTRKLISNLTGTWMTNQQATSADYWTQHLRGTVEFSRGIETLLSSGDRIFLEVGPGGALSSLTRQHPEAPAEHVFASLRHPNESVNDGCYFTFVKAKLWAAGYDLDSKKLWPEEQRRRVPLPTYAFNHQAYWIEPGTAVLQGETTSELERLTDTEEWYSQPVWVQQGALSEKAQPQSWLVFVDESDLLAPVVEDLRSRGHDITTVAVGDSYFKEDKDKYRISPEAGLDGYRALVEDLVAVGRFPDRILHGWLLTTDESFRPGSNFLHRNLEHGFYSLFFLARAVADADLIDKSMHWLVYANGAQQLNDEPLLFPEKATAMGACKAIPRELQGVTCTFVDIDLPHTKTNKTVLRSKKERAGLSESQLKMLFHETTVGAADGVFAYRGDVRFKREYEPLNLANSANAPKPIRKGSTVLITGGLGGIGCELAKQLVSQRRAKIAIVSRTPLPPESEWSAWLKEHATDDPVSQKIRKALDLRSVSPDIRFYVGDVVDRVRMKEVVAEVKADFGSINGVIHAAGQIGDSLIQLKSPAEIEDVFAAKIYGTLVLEESLSEESVDFFAVFSSTSTVIAPVGQIDYIAANDFLNAFAESRRAAGRPFIALNWGIWNEVGMAAGSAARMGYGSGTDHPVSFAVDYPLFSSATRRTQNSVETFSFSMQLTASTWLLDEHRLQSGEAILPGTAYLELARAALRAAGEKAAFEITELVFLKALYVPDSKAVGARVVLRSTASGYAFSLQSEYTPVDGQPMWQTHAEAKISLIGSDNSNSEKLDDMCQQLSFDRSTELGEPLKTSQEEHLQFGSNWQVLRRATYGETTAVGQLELSEQGTQSVATYRLHPGLLDIATGFAMELIEGYTENASNLWVPISYASCRVYGQLPKRIFSAVKNASGNRSSGGLASFDITIFNDTGEVLVDVKGLTIKEMRGAIDLHSPPSPQSLQSQEPEHQASADFRQLSPSELAFQTMLSMGIRPTEGAEAFVDVIENATTAQIVVSSIGLDELRRESERAADLLHSQDVSQKFARPDLDSDYVEPADDVERTLAKFWQDLLGVDRVGVQDNFFTLGGHSLNAVRLFAKIQQAFQVDFPISVLFEAPTIASCADLIRDSIGDYSSDAETSETPEQRKPRYQHLVPMHSTKSEHLRPFFLVAGMFGNVLNLRHLAQLIGDMRPFYGLQARGLFGGSEPHATFEEMAADYIQEMQTVQPHGPYMLGGFSGGGITAYEISRQLIEAGHEVSRLVFLDTPLPYNDPLSSVDRMSIHWQRVKSKGFDYFREWAESRYDWELQKFRKRFGFDEIEKEDPAAFQSGVMEVAFYQALAKYKIQPLDVRTTLLRPRLPVEYHLSGGRMAREDRQIVMDDNGWSRYVNDLDVFEVPGDHDSMVLEPNVRILADKLRGILNASEKTSLQQYLQASVSQLF